MRNTMRLLRPASIAALVTALSATAAFAHAGDHSHMSAMQLLSHQLGAVDHLLAWVALGVLVSLLGSVLAERLHRPR
jgi:hydrogenase/urease accessory protein HupE